MLVIMASKMRISSLRDGVKGMLLNKEKVIATLKNLCKFEVLVDNKALMLSVTVLSDKDDVGFHKISQGNVS